jgi:hypothetical protein
MALIDLQRSVVDVCFGLEPSRERLFELGDERIFSVYREAVRKRLRSELEVALKRTFAAADSAAIERVFARFLSEQPPRSRFFHALVAEFARFAVPIFERESEPPRYLADLCAYEAAIWAVSDLPDRVPEAVGEFGFDKQAVLSPALVLLSLRHSVHLDQEPEALSVAGEHYVCVHRRPEEKKARPWTLNATMFALMQRFAAGGSSVAEVVQQVASQRGLIVDQAFLDGLCAVLADFIERGLILGGR